MADSNAASDGLSVRDLDGLRAYAEEIKGTLAKLQGGLDDMRAEMNAVSVTVKSPDGFVTVTVGPRGQLRKLELDARIYRKPDSTKLAATITETLQKATVEAGRKIDEITERYAPGMDIGAQTRGEFKSRANRFDFIVDQIPGGDDR